MYVFTIFVLAILGSTAQSGRPALKLTFTPDDKYMSNHQQIDVKCELVNPNEQTEAVQLWHVDLKSGKRTAFSRQLISHPPDDAPDVIKTMKNKRYTYQGKGHLLIRSLQPEDSAKYECDCPDCAIDLGIQSRVLSVVKTATPVWTVEPGWPVHEDTKVTIKCQVDDFFPYVSHKIYRNNQDITNEGKSTLPSSQGYPQKFIWEATIKPTADFHNSTLYCNVTQGGAEQQASKRLEVLFAPRFFKCDEAQYIDANKSMSSIECLFGGNPAPTMKWFRQKDNTPLKNGSGIYLDTKYESNGKYKSVLTLDRDILMNLPPVANVNDQGNKTQTTTAAATITPSTADNYFQQLLNDGFTVQLYLNNLEKGKMNIRIVRDASQIRSISSTSSTIKSCSFTLLSFLLILYINRR